jgi:hypothetical protein
LSSSGAPLTHSARLAHCTQATTAMLVTTNLAYGGDKLPGVEGKEATAHAAVAAPGAAILEGAPRAAVTAPLDGAHAAWMGPDSLFIATKSGILLTLSLLWDGASRLRIVREGVYGWEIAHDARRFPSTRFVARTEGFTYDAKVWEFPLAQGPFSVGPEPNIVLRFATFAPLYGLGWV